MVGAEFPMILIEADRAVSEAGIEKSERERP
jgi:hypothetical protein